MPILTGYLVLAVAAATGIVPVASTGEVVGHATCKEVRCP